jgi:type VI protein secretion system component Hcp
MTRIKIAFSIFAGVAVLASPGWAQAPVLKTTTTVTLSSGHACNGSTQPKFDALSVASNVSLPSTTTGAGGGQGGAGRPTFSDITLTKSFDDCSISMYGLLFTGSHVQSAVISFHAADAAGKLVEVLRITLTGALVTSISDNETAPSLPAERVTLSYDRIEILDPVTGERIGWDRQANRPF